MKLRSSVLIALLGVAFIVALQCLWLYNTYQLLKDDLEKELTDLVEESLLKERDLRLDRFYADSTSTALEFDGRADELTRFNEALNEEGLPVSLVQVDSIAKEMLLERNITNAITIDLVEASTGRVMATSNPHFELHFGGFVASQAVAVNYERTHGIRMLVDNPYTIIFGRMIALILASLVLLTLIIWSILQQIHFIRKQDKIANLRQDFTYAMVHDMKTPLSSIIMSLRSLRSGKLDGKEELKQKYMGIAEDEASQLLALTNKILTLSRLENHKLELHVDRVELKPLLDDLVQRFSVKSAKQVTFDVQLTVPNVLADPQYLSEALSNLLDNSIKYSGESVHIEVASHETFGHVILSVKDDGLGISPQDVNTIFEKFERGEAAKRSSQGGASGFGLGLNLVYRIMEAHGGRVEVDSVEGSYSKFSLWFPKEIKTENHE